MISADGLYRYTLSRRWGSGPGALFIGLNPSRADASIDDQSTRRMMSFAKAAGCGGLTLTNLYAWRSPSPHVLRQVPDPVGRGNDQWIASAAAEADVVVAAWGTHADAKRVVAVESLLRRVTVWCLGRTKHGQPRHPLYVPSSAELEVYAAAEPAHDLELSRISNPGILRNRTRLVAVDLTASRRLSDCSRCRGRLTAHPVGTGMESSS